MMGFDYCEEYLKGVYQTKYYYSIVKPSTSLFSSDLQINKKINNVKEDPRRKSDSNFDFSQALRCLVVMRFCKKECYLVHIIELFLHQKRLK